MEEKIRIYSNNNKYIYDVYTDGSIFDVVKNKYTTVTKNNNGYFQTYIHFNNKGRTYGVHRIVLMVFNPVEGMENLQVNHKDGNKLNNHLDNLEWVTPSENQIHAFKTGLAKALVGENNGAFKLSDKDVNNICYMLENNMSPMKISKMYNVSFQLIYGIRSGEFRKDISKNYNFNYPKRITEGEAENICKLIIDGKTSREISLYMDIPKTKVDNIRYGKSWKNIGEKYKII